MSDVDASVTAAAEARGANGPVPARLLTVCVPTYARPDTLERALISISTEADDLAGDVSFVISDNSPAESRPVVERFIQRWPGEVTYLPNATNIGGNANVNQALQHATGEWVLMFHDDDLMRPDGLRHILHELRAGPDCDVLLFGVDVVDATGRIRRRQTSPRRYRLSPPQALRRLLSDSSFVRVPALVTRRTAIVEVGMFDATVGLPSDFDLFVRLFARFGVMCIPKTIAAYVVHEGAATAQMFSPEVIATQMRIFGRATATGLLPPAVIRRAEVDWFHQFILAGVYRQLRNGHIAESRGTIKLFDLPAVKALGVSRRWWLLRLAFRLLLRLPDRVALTLTRRVADLSPERLWLP